MPSKSPFAVVIDSDPGMALSLRHLLRVICGQSAEAYASPEIAKASLGPSCRPDVTILGRVTDRTSVIKRMKADGLEFVLVIDRSERGVDAESAFWAGADDVIQYPFSLRSFALRLRARVGMLDTPEGRQILQESDSWDDGAYIASQAGLTAAEAQIAHVLISQSGHIVSRDALSYAIDQRPWDYGDRKFDVHVAKIRKKLTAVFGAHISVNTVRSAGYRLSIDAEGMQHLLR